jgi:GT2 family glycosyltransferase
MSIGNRSSAHTLNEEMEEIGVTLSVVIPATDAPLTLARCISAVHACIEPPEELFVIETPETAGPSEARNIGARQARGDVLVFVDSDVEVHSDAIVRIRNAFDSDGDLAAVFGSYDDDPAALGMVSDFRNLLHHHVHQQGAGPATTFWAGLGAVRRKAFLTLGGFDELRFPDASVEDIDLGMRLVASGRRIVLDPAIQGKHLKHWTLLSMARTDLLRRGVPWVRLLLDHGSASTALNLGWRRRASATTSLALVGAVVAGRPRLAASLAVILVGLNRPFYALLLEKRGALAALAGIPLQLVHDLTSAAAVPLGLAAHLLDGSARQSRLS